jgi:hypothetical protein
MSEFLFPVLIHIYSCGKDQRVFLVLFGAELSSVAVLGFFCKGKIIYNLINLIHFIYNLVNNHTIAT